MARKSRKFRYTALIQPQIPDAVGYTRLSVAEKEKSDSIENQKRVIEQWGGQHQTPISHYYIDSGFSGTDFNRPAFQALLQDILDGKIDCVVVKDLSRFGRDYIATGYYIEVLFPSKGVRFVSVNDEFDTVDGITNQAIPCCSRIRVPITNIFNGQVPVDIKKKVEATLVMKAQHGEFIGPRPPFGYQKSASNANHLVPDPIASVTVKKIFELAAEGTGITAIVRYLNEKEVPTPIQYARSNGLSGNFNDGNGSWNSRSVKYILTNRTYTGMLIQGKEKRVVEGTHEALVDGDTFESIQKAFLSKAFNLTPKGLSVKNILRGKVICGCCGGKMQRRRGSDHADWYFFTCITKNRLGAGRCTGMYVREEDIFKAIYHQLKLYIEEHFISDMQYKRQICQFNEQIEQAAKRSYEANIDFKLCYEKFVDGNKGIEDLQAARDIANHEKVGLEELMADKADYEKQYWVFCKLLKASKKEVPLSEIVNCIEKIVVGAEKKITVRWVMASKGAWC